METIKYMAPLSMVNNVFCLTQDTHFKPIRLMNNMKTKFL